MAGRRWKIEKKTTKNKKKHWLAVLQKRNLDQNINDSKFKIIFFENIYMNIQFLYEFFFNFRFFCRKSQSQHKLPIKITHLTIRFRSRHLTHFLNLSSVDIENNMSLQHSQNLSEFTKKFPANMFQVRKNTCTPPFLDAQNCILEVLCKKRRSKILSDEAWVGGVGGCGGWIIPLKRLVFLAS